MRLKVAAFDVDGTLYPNSAAYLRAIPFVLRNLSLLRSFGRIRKEIRRVRPIEDFYRTQAELLATDRGIPREEAERLINEVFYGQWGNTILGVKLFPHVREVLSGLRAAGVRLAALSDFPPGKKIAAWRLEGLWDYAKSCEEIGYLKPNGEPFRDLVNFFAVEPGEILYVGNNYAYDIVGAKEQGLMAAHVTRRAPRGSRADFSFFDYRRLGEWIAEFLEAG